MYFYNFYNSRYKHFMTLNLKQFLFCSFFFIGYISQSVAQQDQVTLSGYINDGSSGETLIGATAYLKESGVGATSNEYGYYSISVPPGNYTVEYAYLGFVSTIKKIDLNTDKKVDIELNEESEIIEEIVITAEPEDENVTNVEMSVNKLDLSLIHISEPTRPY